jgi:hypothetical protein
MSPDAAAVAAYEALRRKEWEAVVDAAVGVVAPDRPALEARGAAFAAQALRELGRIDEAERAAARAVSLAKRAGDTAGVAQLRALHAEILQRVAAARAVEAERARDAPLADTPDDALLAGVPAADQPALLVRKAGALADAGRGPDALAAAERAREAARLVHNPREEVLALLTAARVDDPARWIREAHTVADATDDMNLITAVAKAARAARITLAAPSFG